MPIYAYKCASCGHAKDVLQKMSDAPLTACPACGAEAFSKQLTAAGFQLKGSGWYVTDFREGSKPAATPAAPPFRRQRGGNHQPPATLHPRLFAACFRGGSGRVRGGRASPGAVLELPFRRSLTLAALLIRP